jgi:hypothetical protein
MYLIKNIVFFRSIKRPHFVWLFLCSKMFLLVSKQPFGKMRAWLEYHPKGRNFASENNSDRRGGGGKDKMKP